MILSLVLVFVGSFIAHLEVCVCVCVRACALRRMLCMHAVPKIQRSEKIIWGLVLTIHFVCDSVSSFSMRASG